MKFYLLVIVSWDSVMQLIQKMWWGRSSRLTFLLGVAIYVARISANAGVEKMRSINRAFSSSNFKRSVLACVLCTALLSACATHGRPETYAEPFGFFSGIWHGLISGITITVNIISWFLHLFGVEFLRDVQIIGRPNTGFGYYVGFILGFFIYPSSASR
jgi:hypothetical protein